MNFFSKFVEEQTNIREKYDTQIASHKILINSKLKNIPELLTKPPSISENNLKGYLLLKFVLKWEKETVGFDHNDSELNIFKNAIKKHINDIRYNLNNGSIKMTLVCENVWTYDNEDIAVRYNIYIFDKDRI